jgi:two-component system cell cycle sensor histidine kinase/response regulator CckA
MNYQPGTADHIQRVLIVDDERPNRQVLEAMLMPEGVAISTAASGEEALACVGVEPPDLILLDVMMPGMDGYEVARMLKGNAATQNIPVIMITALGDRDARMRGLGAGAEDFLSKPVDRAELCVRVRNLLRLKAFSDYYGKYSEMLELKVEARTADLADRTRALEEHAAALRRSEERTHYALGAARMGVWELDVNTQRIWWSETMASVFGLSSERAPAATEDFLALVHVDDRQAVREAVADAARTGADFVREFRVIWPDGGTRWLAGRAQLVRDVEDAPARLLGVAIDISDRKALEAQFRQAQKMEAIGQMAGGVAHDFNNLLTVISSYSELVLQDSGMSSSHRNDIEQVINAATSAAGLTRQLLAFSRKEAVRPGNVELNGLVAGMEPMLGRLVGHEKKLSSVLSPELGIVRADKGQLEQVLMNLVVNARDATPAGGILAIETANLELRRPSGPHDIIPPGSFVTLAVRDNGTGMDEATKERLFEPFFTTKEPGRGTGLGLATVYGIVKQSGGYIRVDSAPGAGATFTVLLPRASQEQALS